MVYMIDIYVYPKQLGGISKEMMAWTDEVANTTEKNDAII